MPKIVDWYMEGKLNIDDLITAAVNCNEETFMTKAGAQHVAAELGLIVIGPDIRP